MIIEHELSQSSAHVTELLEHCWFIPRQAALQGKRTHAGTGSASLRLFGILRKLQVVYELSEFLEMMPGFRRGYFEQMEEGIGKNEVFMKENELRRKLGSRVL